MTFERAGGVTVDLAAVAANVAALRARTAAEVMAVVKADGFGHGMLPVATAAVRAGADWLGVCKLEDALALRRAGFGQPVFAWLITPGEPVADAVHSEVDISVSAGWLVDELAAAAAAAGRPARVHLELDTGMSRGGATAADWPALVAAVATRAAAGLFDVVGIWTHLACADVPGHPLTARQLDLFRAGLAVATAAGLRPRLRHAANSAALFGVPAAAFDLVRPGLAVYGLSPLPWVAPAELGLRPAMTLTGRVQQAGTGWAAVPGGAAAGLPPVPSGTELAYAGGTRLPVLARRADHLIIGTGRRRLPTGTPIVLFGPGDSGEPTAADWARAADTIPNEVLVRVGQAVPRTYRPAPTERTAYDRVNAHLGPATGGAGHPVADHRTVSAGHPGRPAPEAVGMG